MWIIDWEKSIFIQLSLHLACKYASIFAHGHVHVPRSELWTSRNRQCPRASNYTSMFLHQMEVFVIIILQIFLQCIRQNIYKQLIVYCISEFSMCLYQQKNIPFFCNNRKNLSQHEIKNKKKTFTVFDMSYFKLRHSQSHDVSRSILQRQNYLMDYNTDCKPPKILVCWWSCKCIRNNHHVAS